MERLYDFEEECVEGYFRETEIALHQSTDERIKATNERVENMSQKVEDINQKENLQSATVQVNIIQIHTHTQCLVNVSCPGYLARSVLFGFSICIELKSDMGMCQNMIISHFLLTDREM